MLIQIVAAAANNAIGLDNKLLWHLPDDFKHFKTITTGHHIIMGRKTFESFPKPLPNRIHIIISHTKQFDFENCITVQTIDEALQLAPKNQKTYIIGGAQIYKQTLPFCDGIELTRVHHSFEADTFYPEIDMSIFKMIKNEFHKANEKHQFDFSFQTYIRI